MYTLDIWTLQKNKGWKQQALMLVEVLSICWNFSYWYQWVLRLDHEWSAVFLAGTMIEHNQCKAYGAVVGNTDTVAAALS